MVLLVTTGYYWVLGGTGWYRGALEYTGGRGGIAGYWGYCGILGVLGSNRGYWVVLWSTVGYFWVLLGYCSVFFGYFGVL